MDIEYDGLKYNRPNYTPDLLFRPPTSVVHGELEYLARNAASALEGNCATPKARILRIGSEWEMIFFNPEIDPIVAKEKYPNHNYRARNYNNPNYSEGHMLKLEAIADDYGTMCLKYPDMFDDLTYYGKPHLFFEFRTQPLPIGKYLQATDRFRDKITNLSFQLGVMPVVHSQHIHISLQAKCGDVSRGFDNSDGEKKGAYRSIYPEDDDLRGTFRMTHPLMLLPEEWCYNCNDNGFYQTDDGKRYRSTALTLPHIEFRALSSEYAHDPLLNLVVSLRAMLTGIEGGARMSLFENSNDFQKAVRGMISLPELRKFFSLSTLNQLTDIVYQYPDVSMRKITIGQVKT
jgi:hypothetical protein